DLAGQFCGALGLGDPARVDQTIRHAELLEPLEKEWTLFREEQCLPGIDDKLPRIRLDLGEVGVRSAVQREVVRHAPTDVAADLRARTIVRPTGWARETVRFLRHDGIEIEDDTAIEPGKPLQGARLRQEGGIGTPRGRPR